MSVGIATVGRVDAEEFDWSLTEIPTPRAAVRSQFSQATEIDARAPFAQLVLHINRELIHHGSEICTLTDLYRAGVRG